MTLEIRNNLAGFHVKTANGYTLSVIPIGFECEFALLTPQKTPLKARGEYVNHSPSSCLPLWIDLLYAYDSGVRDSKEKDAISEAEYEYELQYRML